MIFRRKTGWIGIDVGTHAVKLAQVARQPAGVRLVEALIIGRRNPWMADDSQGMALSSADEIRAALSLGRGFRGRQSALTLSMALCDTRGVHLLDGSDAERYAELAREINAPNGDGAQLREFDFWTTPMAAERQPGAENGILFSVAREWAERLAGDVEECRLVGQTLDALPMALARAVTLGPPGPEPAAAIDWGCGRALFCVVRQGRPVFVRGLRDAGFAPLVNSVCRALSLNRDEAQNLLVQHGLSATAGDPPDQLCTVIEDVTAESRGAFVEEVQRTLVYLRQQRRAIAPSRILLFGAGATLRNVAEHLTRRLETPVSVWQLEGETPNAQRERALPSALLAPAIALSALAWMRS